MAVGMALVMMSGCQPKQMTYDQLDATRANAINGLARADAALDRVSDLEDRVAELETKLGS